MVSTRQRGRPRKFDREEALIAAIHVFWQKGYDGASMKDLTSAMGINGPSLYAAFGDKKTLYLEAIEAYVTNDACKPLVAFEAEPEIQLAVLAFMESAIEGVAGCEHEARGCFLGSCVATTAGEIQGVEQLLSDAIEATENKIAGRFDLEKKAGNLPPQFPSRERAALMLDLRQGHAFRARAGLSIQAMSVGLQYRAQMVLGAPS